MPPDDWYLNPEARGWRSEPPASARAFHRTLPGYEPTPLNSLPSVARELGVSHVLVKDESHRLGLPAFKILGASWAVCRALSEANGLDLETATVAGLAQFIREVPPGLRPVLVTATDGNHGRAIARVARLLGVAARVYLPRNVSSAARQAIRDEGADVVETGLAYDDTVAYAAESTWGRMVDLLLQDTSWQGYTDIPRWIVDGYATLFEEIDEAVVEADLSGPHLVASPVGVGSFAQAMVDHYRSREGETPSLLSVEPESAACLLRSLAAGELLSVETGSTIMTGLNCGTPTELGWPSLAGGIDAAVSVSDDECRKAVEDLSRLGQDSGPCGASTLAGVRKVLASPGRRVELGVSKRSVVVLVSTEGLDANPLPPA